MKRRFQIVLQVDYDLPSPASSHKAHVNNYALEIAKEAYGDRLVFCSIDEVSLNLEPAVTLRLPASSNQAD